MRYLPSFKPVASTIILCGFVMSAQAADFQCPTPPALPDSAITPEHNIEIPDDFVPIEPPDDPIQPPDGSVQQLHEPNTVYSEPSTTMDSAASGYSYDGPVTTQGDSSTESTELSYGDLGWSQFYVIHDDDVVTDDLVNKSTAHVFAREFTGTVISDGYADADAWDVTHYGCVKTEVVKA